MKLELSKAINTLQVELAAMMPSNVHIQIALHIHPSSGAVSTCYTNNTQDYAAAIADIDWLFHTVCEILEVHPKSISIKSHRTDIVTIKQVYLYLAKKYIIPKYHVPIRLLTKPINIDRSSYYHAIRQAGHYIKHGDFVFNSFLAKIVAHPSIINRYEHN